MRDRQPRIAFVIDDLGIGGAQRQLALIACALARDFEPRVAVLSSILEPNATTLRACDVPVVAIARRYGLDVGRLLALVRAVRGADVIHGFLDASNAYAFLAARLLRRPAVLFMSSDRILIGGVRAHVLRWMLRRADAVTVNSAAGAAFLTDTLDIAPARICRVPNIVPVADPPPPSRAGGPPVIGCVARLVSIKRVDAVIAALARVREAVPGTRLLVVGDGPERAALEGQAGQLGLADAVTFAGALDRPLEAMATMTCLVVASAFEGLPNAALEALSLGLPVVAAPVGDLGWIIRDGITGVRVEDATTGALARAIIRALGDDGLQAAARNEGPRLVCEYFSDTVVLRDLITTYRRLAR